MKPLSLYLVTFRISEWGDITKQAEVGALNQLHCSVLLRKYMHRNRHTFDLPDNFNLVITDTIRVGYVGTEGVIKIQTV